MNKPPKKPARFIVKDVREGQYTGLRNAVREPWQVIDTDTNSTVDELHSKRAADMTASAMNKEAKAKEPKNPRPHALPVRDDVTEVTYHRPPTKYELKIGEGAIHYRTFPVETCCYPNTRVLKRWFKADDDGLRYYR